MRKIKIPKLSSCRIRKGTKIKDKEKLWKIVQEMPRNVAKRKRIKTSWEDIEGEDKDLYKKIIGLANKYGYDIGKKCL